MKDTPDEAAMESVREVVKDYSVSPDRDLSATPQARKVASSEIPSGRNQTWLDHDAASRKGANTERKPTTTGAATAGVPHFSLRGGVQSSPLAPRAVSSDGVLSRRHAPPAPPPTLTKSPYFTPRSGKSIVTKNPKQAVVAGPSRPPPAAVMVSSRIPAVRMASIARSNQSDSIDLTDGDDP